MITAGSITMALTLGALLPVATAKSPGESSAIGCCPLAKNALALARKETERPELA